jgi:hypothetical protein
MRGGFKWDKMGINGFKEELGIARLAAEKSAVRARSAVPFFLC